MTGLWGLHHFAWYARNMLTAMSPGEAADTQIVFLNFHHFKRFNRRYGYEEGDMVLCRFAGALQACAAVKLAGRIAEDHFLFLVAAGDVVHVLREMQEALRRITPDTALSIRAGIYNIDAEESVIAAGDKAKAAADSLRGKKVGDQFWHYYDHELETAMERRTYVLENIEKAIQSGWIRVYYQPVMRTMTERLCGMEALARWEDPVYGMMSPGLFIPVLEENQLIHKLDLHVLKKICEDYRNSRRTNKPFVPVSFNLSRLDFELCDILSEVDNLVTEYEVPKEMLHVEITESVLLENEWGMRKTLDDFHKLGYQVWMDDFGSGYSTLNVLKDYDFDTLKIDMRFLSDMSSRSLSIVTSVVDMAKKIGIQTLAEGVETREQVDFLRSIGCEKLQGYYFGRPAPYDLDDMQQLELQGRIENEREASYYNEIGRVNLIDDRAVALVEYENDTFRIPYMNRNLVEELENVRPDLSLILESLCNDEAFPAYDILRKAARRIPPKGGQHTVRFVSGGRYFLLYASCVGQLDGKKMFLAYISDMSEDSELTHTHEMDEAIRSLYLTCDNVYINDMDAGTVHTILDHGENPGQLETWRLQIDPAGYAKARIYPGDQKRYLAFADMSTLYSRLQNSPSGFLGSYFRTKNEKGEYIWKRHLFVLISKLGQRRFVSAAQPVKQEALLENAKAILEVAETQRLIDIDMLKDATTFSKQLSPAFTDEQTVRANAELASPRDFWSGLILHSDIKFCWKDARRCYVGASQAFLDYFKLSSVTEILGKRDEDMGWHAEGRGFAQTENRILREGQNLVMSPEKCLAGGKLRNIWVNKQPLYRGGKVNGILIWFVDSEELTQQESPAEEGMDSITGCMNVNGFMLTGEQFRRDYIERGRDYAFLYVAIHEFGSFKNKNGVDTANRFLREIATRMKEAVGREGLIGRIWMDNFVIFVPAESQRDAEKTADSIRREVSRIHRIGEVPVTVYLSIGYSLYSERENVEQCTNLARARMKKEREAVCGPNAEDAFD